MLCVSFTFSVVHFDTDIARRAHCTMSIIQPKHAVCKFCHTHVIMVYCNVSLILVCVCAAVRYLRATNECCGDAFGFDALDITDKGFTMAVWRIDSQSGWGQELKVCIV